MKDAFQTRFWPAFMVLSMLVFLVYPSFSLPARAEDLTVPEEYHLPGTIYGEGTFFEITDSEYLNLTLTSSERIQLLFESVPNLVTMHFEPISGAVASQITLTGFLPMTTYYKYEDDYHNLVEFTTDEFGRYIYVQDFTKEHFVFIQTLPSTKYIRDDATGGDCTTVGTWDMVTKTCTLNTDIFETIQIDSNGVTLDGNGHTVRNTSWGIFVPDKKSGFSVKNLNIKNNTFGFHLAHDSNNGTIINNTITNNSWGGIYTLRISNYTIANNIVSNNSWYGIRLIYLSNNNTIKNNTIESNGKDGIGLEFESSGNTITDNIISGNGRGIYLYYRGHNSTIKNNTITNNIGEGILSDRSNGHIIQNNLISNNQREGLNFYKSSNSTVIKNTISDNDMSGIYLYDYSNGNTLYYNNIINNGAIEYDFSTNIWNNSAGEGNYWSNYTGQDLNGNGIGDTNLPHNGMDWYPLMNLWTPNHTPFGSNIQVTPHSDVAVTFSEITGVGDTTATVSETNPGGDKTGFKFLGKFYNITTTATYTPSVTVCINYDDTGMSQGKENSLKIFHWVDPDWVNVTFSLDTVNNVICGTVDSLSWFAAAYDEAPPDIVVVRLEAYGLYQIGMALEFSAIDDGSGLATIEGILTNVTGEIQTVQSGYIPEPGVYSLMVSATDMAGNTSQSQPIPFVVYDPVGGFATGGGWFYPDAESSLATGNKATFGFVAKYKQGLSTGNLEFQYHGANGINLKSTTIDWLVISATGAQFQGTGTINNGQGLYTFRVQAKDFGELGIGIDHFDIRIWQGTDISIDPLHKAKNILSGGNIVVHKN